MSRQITILGLGLVAVATAIIAWPLLSRSSRETKQPVFRPDPGVAAQAYPPPTGSPPAPTATPPADPAGYFPPPSGIPNQTVTLAGSPYSDVLVPLQAALRGGDAAAIAALAGERFNVTLFDVAWLDSEGGVELTAAQAEAILADFFGQGSRPLIQGYFDNGDATVPCLMVLTHGYSGTVAYPAAADPDYGPRLPADIPADAAGFTLCRAGSAEWIWQDWVYGGYHALAEQYYGARESGYNVVRP